MIHKLVLILSAIALAAAGTLDMLHRLPHGMDIIGVLTLINFVLLMSLPKSKPRS